MTISFSRRNLLRGICHRVQTGSGAYPASCPMGSGGSFPGCKAVGVAADHSLPSSAEVKKV